MSNSKKPWDDVPIEVLIEWERKKNEKQKERPRAPCPTYSPRPLITPSEEDAQEDGSEFKIVIEMV